MSRWHARVPASALHSTRNPVDRAVLVTIALYADRTGTSRIAVSQIAAESGISRATAYRALSRLRECGAITVVSGTGRTVSTYRLPVDNSVVVSPVRPLGSQKRGRSGLTGETHHIEHSQRARRGAPVDNAECPHGDPYGGRRCIDCRQERTA